VTCEVSVPGRNFLIVTFVCPYLSRLAEYGTVDTLARVLLFSIPSNCLTPPNGQHCLEALDSRLYTPVQKVLADPKVFQRGLMATEVLVLEYLYKQFIFNLAYLT